METTQRQYYRSLIHSTQVTVLTVLMVLHSHLMEVAYSQHYYQQQQQQHPCPEECSCFQNFASCHGFTEGTLRALPEDVQSLVLIRGTMRSLPPRFLTRFPQLTFLEIQSTQLEAVVHGTFSGAELLDHLAIMDCGLGDVETGAFQNLQNVSLLMISDSQVGTVHPGAFSALRDVQELSIVSSEIENVERGAFQDLSGIGSFTFAQNNVTALDKEAFRDVRQLGKVDMQRNNFQTGFQASAVIPLVEASDKAEVFSNNVECSCSSVQAFHRPRMLPFLQSQVCTVPDTGEVVKLSRLNVSELCLNQPTTPPATATPETDRRTSSRVTGENDPSFQNRSGSVTQTYPTSTAPANSPTPRQSPSSSEAGGENAAEAKSPESSSFSLQSASNSSPSAVSGITDVSRTIDVTESDLETITPRGEKNQNSGLSEDSSKVENGAVSGTPICLLALLAPCLVSWVVRQQLGNTQ